MDAGPTASPVQNRGKTKFTGTLPPLGAGEATLKIMHAGCNAAQVDTPFEVQDLSQPLIQKLKNVPSGSSAGTGKPFKLDVKNLPEVKKLTQVCVSFGTVKGTVVQFFGKWSRDSTKLQVQPPAYSLGSGVTSQEVECTIYACASPSKVARFTYKYEKADAPLVMSGFLKPNKGFVSGEERVVLKIKNFPVIASAAEVEVMFGSSFAEVVFVQSNKQNTEVHAMSPAVEAAGQVMVTLIPRGDETMKASTRFDYQPQPNPSMSAVADGVTDDFVAFGPQSGGNAVMLMLENIFGEVVI